MKGLVRRAICAVAGSLAFAGAAYASAPAVNPVVDPAGVFSLPQASYGPPADARLALSGATTTITLSGGINLQVGDKIDLSGAVAPVDVSGASAFGGLFLSSASSGMPYVAFGGDFLGVSSSFGNGLHVSAAIASLSPQTLSYSPDAGGALARMSGLSQPFEARSADSLLAGVSWDATKWASIGLIATQTSEHDGLLNIPAPGTNANTSALGVSARVRLGNGWVTTATYSEGFTQLDLKAAAIPSSGLASDGLRTRSYGIAIAKNGLFGDDRLGVSVSRPAFGADGDFITTTPGDGAAVPFFARNRALDGSQETDVEIGYITSFMDGSLALQTNASFQMNYGGQTGTNAVSLLSRARIKF